jgi:hypothetical protein
VDRNLNFSQSKATNRSKRGETFRTALKDIQETSQVLAAGTDLVLEYQLLDYCNQVECCRNKWMKNHKELSQELQNPTFQNQSRTTLITSTTPRNGFDHQMTNPTCNRTKAAQRITNPCKT